MLAARKEMVLTSYHSPYKGTQLLSLVKLEYCESLFKHQLLRNQTQDPKKNQSRLSATIIYSKYIGGISHQKIEGGNSTYKTMHSYLYIPGKEDKMAIIHIHI